jgi:predicted ATPase/DNA-binding CsgD family transcriptional regulator
VKTSDRPPTRDTDDAAGRLPAQVSSFVGRAREVDDVETRVGQSRLVTLTGPGGSGKTRLAIAVAARLHEAGLTVDFVELAPITDANLAVGAIAAALGVREAAGESLLDALVRRAQNVDSVLLLDNLEQIAGIGELVAELLSRSPGLRVLATSRIPLHVRGEREYPVEPLPEADAITLFADRASAVRPDGALSAAQPAIAAICARLDGLPLAIELAAARTRVFGPEALLARLDRRLAVTVDGSADAPVRQRTLRSAIAWSVELLDAPERRLFAAAATFAGSFGLEAFEAVASDTTGQESTTEIETGLQQLVEHNLVRVTPGPDGEPRFRLLETIREFGLEQQSVAERAMFHDRHLRYYVESAERSEKELRGPNQAATLRKLTADQADIRAALAWAQETGRDELLVRLAAALRRRFWYEAGGLAEGKRWLDAAMALDGADAAPYGAKVLQRAAWIVWEMGDGARAEALFEASLAAADVNDHLSRFEALIGLSYRSIQGGSSRVDEATARLAQAIEHARRSGSPGALVEPLIARAHLAESTGDREQSAASFEEARMVALEAGDVWAAAEASVVLGGMALDAGDPSRALQMLEECARLAGESGDRGIVAEAMTGMTRALIKLGRLVAAREQLRATFDELGGRVNPVTDVFLLEAAAHWLATVGAFAASIEAWGAAERLGAGHRWPETGHEESARRQLMTAARDELGPVAFELAWTSGKARTGQSALAAAWNAAEAVDLDKIVTRPKAKSRFDLTAREQEVLALVAAGMSDGEIAESLFISKKTASVHVANVKAKLGASTRVEIATIALRDGL